MPPSLSPDDVARLISEPSAVVRADLAQKLATDLSGPSLTPSEVRLGQDIVRILARDVEEGVRAALSRELRHCKNLPPDVARKLAEDVERISLPILTDSLVLTDEDLIEIVRDGSSAKQKAIAKRPNLAETVSDALIARGDEPAIMALMENNTATISESGFDHVVTRFADSEAVKRAMVYRDRLPATVAERLVTMVSKALQAHLVQVHDLPPATAADLVLTSREHAIIHLSLGASDSTLQQMVKQMHSNRRLTPSVILRALCSGDIAFFEAAMAARADIPLENAQILIHETSRRGLAALYEKGGMPAALYEPVQAAIKAIDETEFDGQARDLERFRSRIISRVLTRVDDVSDGDADYLIGKLAEILIHAPEPQDPRLISSS